MADATRDFERPLRILACSRQLPQGKSEGPQVVGCLVEAGCDVTVTTRGGADFSGFDVVLFLGNLAWFPEMRNRLLRLRGSCRAKVALWHWEPLPPPGCSGLPWPTPTFREAVKILIRDRRANDIYTNHRLIQACSRAGLIDVLYASTPGRVEFLAERGIAAEYAPLGYDPEHGCDLGLPRDIDTIFVGDLRIGRRKRLIRRLRRSGLSITACGGWRQPQFWGADRARLLNRAKIFLNVLRFEGEFSGLRMILGMANGSLVLSEPMYRPEPFVPGEHFVCATPAEMPEAIRYYLQRADERERIARNGRELVTSQLTLKRSVRRVVESLKQRVQS